MPPMPEHDAEQPPVRPEVVQAIFSALIDMDPDKLAPLEAGGITPAERQQAEQLFLASFPAIMDQRERWLEAMQVLIGDRKLTEGTSWADLFDRLDAGRLGQIRDLYDALDDGARAEYDRRYGRPEEI